MRRNLKVLAIVSLLALASSSNAQYVLKSSGELVSISQAEIVVDVGTKKTYKIDASTKLLGKDGRPAAASSFKKGDQVVVTSDGSRATEVTKGSQGMALTGPLGGNTGRPIGR